MGHLLENISSPKGLLSTAVGCPGQWSHHPWRNLEDVALGARGGAGITTAHGDLKGPFQM